MLLRAEVFSGDTGNLGFFKQVVGDIARGFESFAVGNLAEEIADIGKDVKCAFGF